MSMPCWDDRQEEGDNKKGGVTEVLRVNQGVSEPKRSKISWEMMKVKK